MFHQLKSSRPQVVMGAILLAVYFLMALGPAPAFGQEPFYKGKTIRFIVGFSAGGGFDTYTRLIARHMGRHIPGNPTMIVENMAGAGSLIAGNYIYKAKPDGLTIGNWLGLLALQQVMGEKRVEFDARKFEWIGAPLGDSNVCALTRGSGVSNVDQWFGARRPVKIGGIAPGSPNSDIPRILKETLDLPIQVVDGYKGTADLRLAADSGEVDGGCWAWESIKVTWRKGIESGNVRVVLQVLAKRHPELPDVPNAIELAKTEEARQLIKVGITDPSAVSRPYSLPPGTAKDKVKILRDAFMATMKDPQFLAEAKKSNLDLSPYSGEEIERIVQGFYRLPPALIMKLKDIVVPKK